MIDAAAEFVLFLPSNEGIGDALDTFIRNEVLGVAFFEELAGVGFGPVEKEDDARFSIHHLGHNYADFCRSVDPACI